MQQRSYPRTSRCTGSCGVVRLMYSHRLVSYSFGSHPSRSRNSNFCRSTQMTIRIWRVARALPTHANGPSPNETKAVSLCTKSSGESGPGSRASSESMRMRPDAMSQRSGQNMAGNEKLRGSLCRVEGGIQKIVPGGMTLTIQCKEYSAPNVSRRDVVLTKSLQPRRVRGLVLGAVRPCWWDDRAEWLRVYVNAK